MNWKAETATAPWSFVDMREVRNNMERVPLFDLTCRTYYLLHSDEVDAELGTSFSCTLIYVPTAIINAVRRMTPDAASRCGNVIYIVPQGYTVDIITNSGYKIPVDLSILTDNLYHVDADVIQKYKELAMTPNGRDVVSRMVRTACKKLCAVKKIA